MQQLTLGTMTECFTSRSTRLNLPEVTSVSFGQYASAANEAVAIGTGTIANDTTIAIGYKSKALHKNSVILGSNIQSRCEGHFIAGDFETKEGNINVSDVLKIYSNNTDDTIKCTGCSNSFRAGINWVVDTELDISHSLCFDCILGCVINNNAANNWNLHTNNSNQNNVNHSLNSEILHLKNQVEMLSDQLKCIYRLIDKNEKY